MYIRFWAGRTIRWIKRPSMPPNIQQPMWGEKGGRPGWDGGVFGAAGRVGNAAVPASVWGL